MTAPTRQQVIDKLKALGGQADIRAFSQAEFHVLVQLRRDFTVTQRSDGTVVLLEG